MTLLKATGSATAREPAARRGGSAGWNLIGGRWVASDGPRTREIRNPADTTELVASVREASAGQVEAACAAAA